MPRLGARKKKQTERELIEAQLAAVEARQYEKLGGVKPGDVLILRGVSDQEAAHIAAGFRRLPAFNGTTLMRLKDGQTLEHWTEKEMNGVGWSRDPQGTLRKLRAEVQSLKEALKAKKKAPKAQLGKTVTKKSLESLRIVDAPRKARA